MRFLELNQLNEATLNIATFGKRNPEYWPNLIDMIENGRPVAIGNGEEKVEIANGSDVADQMRAIWDGSELATPEQIEQIKRLGLPTTDGKKISITNIYKSPEIKGKEADYNIGDIGEIALGVASAARFNKLGEEIDVEDFVNIATQLKIQGVAKKTSYSATFESKLKHTNGKTDVLSVKIVTAGRSLEAFEKFVRDMETAPKNVRGTILSSINYANEQEKIEEGIVKTKKDPNQNRIEISAVGTENQKGTKADLVMNIDGQRINLLSAKAGQSQLGQGSGKDFNTVSNFFNKIFAIDISPYQKSWTNDNEQNLAVLKNIYNDLVIPKILKLTSGDSTQKEAGLVKQIAMGLIYFSNDVGAGGESEIVDIVKLITTPDSPGYKLMRVDDRLYSALEKVDLVGEPTPNRQGVQVSGLLNGKKLLLFKARSYFSPAANLTRNIIEGGPLLDQLAVIEKPKPKLSQAYIIQLKGLYGNLQQLTPAQQKQLNNEVNRLTPSQLKQLADANIKWASDAARRELQRRNIA